MSIPMQKYDINLLTDSFITIIKHFEHYIIYNNGINGTFKKGIPFLHSWNCHYSDWILHLFCASPIIRWTKRREQQKMMEGP